MVLLAISGGGWFGLIVLALVVAIIVVIAMNYQKVGPNEVLIVSGGIRQTVEEPDGATRTVGYKMSVGGGSVVWPFFQTFQVLPLEIFTVQVKADEALTKNGVQLSAVGMSQVKVGSAEHAIRRAAEQFVGRGGAGIREAANQILEGLLRAYLGSATVEEIYQNRDEFNDRMVKEAGEEFRKMGLELISFALIDLSDKQGYLAALGKPQIAAVKRDAEIAEAETVRDTHIKTSEAQKAGDIARLRAEQEVAEANRDFEMARAGFAAEVNQKKAAADMAYDLERQREAQSMKELEIAVKIAERKKLIELEGLEVKRKEQELTATVEKTSEARKKQVETEAQAEAFRIEAEAMGQAAAARAAAAAEAEGIRQRGEAEADAMRGKAAAYREYNEAAIYEMLFAALPDLARAVSEPLSKMEKMVIVDTGGDGDGVSKVTGQVAKVLAQMPSVIEALGGVDIKELARRITKQGDDDGDSSAAKKTTPRGGK